MHVFIKREHNYCINLLLDTPQTYQKAAPSYCVQMCPLYTEEFSTVLLHVRDQYAEECFIQLSFSMDKGYWGPKYVGVGNFLHYYCKSNTVVCIRWLSYSNWIVSHGMPNVKHFNSHLFLCWLHSSLLLFVYFICLFLIYICLSLAFTLFVCFTPSPCFLAFCSTLICFKNVDKTNLKVCTTRKYRLKKYSFLIFFHFTFLLWIIFILK